MELDWELEDVKEYASNYSAQGLVRRLLWISKQIPQLNNDVIIMTLHTIQHETANTELYEQICHENAIPLDEAWARTVNIAYYEKLQTLNEDLEKQKRSLRRDMIFKATVEIGQHLEQRGEFSSALMRFLTAREQASSEQDQLEMSWRVVVNSIHAESMTHVSSTAHRALQSQFIGKFPDYAAKFHCALGLNALRSGNYYQAASSFRKACINEIPEGIQFLSGEDIVLYGGISAIASFDRAELKGKVLSDPWFNLIYSKTPWLHLAISLFHKTSYADSLSNLNRFRSRMQLDVFLSPHVEKLFRLIHHRALSHYVSPFSSLSLHKMADAFQLDLTTLESELAYLIQEGRINARIDSANKILIEKSINPRTRAFVATRKTTKKVASQSKATLLRLHMRKNLLFVGKEEGHRFEMMGEVKDFGGMGAF